MTTELKRFTEAYATITMAAHELLIVRWISLIGIRFIPVELPRKSPVHLCLTNLRGHLYCKA